MMKSGILVFERPIYFIADQRELYGESSTHEVIASICFVYER